MCSIMHKKWAGGISYLLLKSSSRLTNLSTAGWNSAHGAKWIGRAWAMQWIAANTNVSCKESCEGGMCNHFQSQIAKSCDLWHFHPIWWRSISQPFYVSIIQVTYKIMQADIMPGSKLTENVKSHPKLDNQFQPHKILQFGHCKWLHIPPSEDSILQCLWNV